MSAADARRWFELASPQGRDDAQAWFMRRRDQLRWPTGTRRRSDKVPLPSPLTVRCVCQVPIPVTTRSRAVVCQTCRRPLRS